MKLGRDQIPQQGTDALATQPIAIVRLPPTLESFGAVAAFLSKHRPFAGFELGTFARSVQAQLATGSNLVALRGNEVVGYAGWLLTTPEVAQEWVEGRGRLRPLGGPTAMAAVLTTVAVVDPRATPLLIRRARELNPGRRAYFRRSPTRKNSVLIYSSPVGD